MSGTRYLPGDVIDECRDVIRRGGSVESLAGRLGVEPAELQSLLGLPGAQRMRTLPAAAGVDLWRDAEGVL